MPASPVASCTVICTAEYPYRNPHQALAAWPATTLVALLHSGGPLQPESRFSYLCVDPFAVLIARGPAVWRNGHPVPGDPLTILAAELARWRLPPQPRFRGGAVGFIGYELGASLHAVAAKPPDPDDPPDLFIAFYDLVIEFDRQTRRCHIHASGWPAQGPARAARAAARLAQAAALLDQPFQPPARPPSLVLQPDWPQPEYEARLNRLLAYIQAGDIYQANLTMRQTAGRPPGLDPRAVHTALHAANPAPFAALLECGEHAVVCSSPERFLQLDAAGRIETRPIKGTIARHPDPAIDAARAAELTASAKDRAENLMIVDVLRNDIGRVATAGSLTVPALCRLESFATVHHLVSRIQAQLRPDLTAIDLLRACLPGGSITGAPKIRAMQIIAELEGARRGPYCGTVVRIGFDGAMDSNIVIRSLVLTPQRIIAQAGGGIVAESDPAAEYAEMMLKSAPMRAVFGAPA